MNELERTLAELSDGFRRRCAEERLELRELMRSGPTEGSRLKEIAHGLAGGGGTFGFPEVSVAARRLGRALAAGRPARAELETLIDVLGKCAKPEAVES